MAGCLVTKAMLPANRPAAGRERLDQPRRRLRPDRKFGHADRQAGRVLDSDVLDVDPGFARRLEQPGQLTGLVADDHLDDRIGGGAAAPRASARARSLTDSSSPCAILASAPDAAARSAATAASTSAACAALEHRIWVHSPVSPAAILVTSRSPWPARPRAPSGAFSSCAAMAADTACGACETSAAQWS